MGSSSTWTMIIRAARRRTDRAGNASEDSSVIPVTSRWAISNADMRWLAPTWTAPRQAPRRRLAFNLEGPPARLVPLSPRSALRDRWRNPSRSIQAVRSVTTQLTSHRSTYGQVIAGRHSADGLPAYKRGATGSNPVAPTRLSQLAVRTRRSSAGFGHATERSGLSCWPGGLRLVQSSPGSQHDGCPVGTVPDVCQRPA